MPNLNDVPPWQQPYPFWFWNGEMDADEIRRQIGLMREAGITEFVIHGRTGLQTPFLSDAWFDAARAAVEEAARRGMRAWIYDEYNWPSGTANSTITADPAMREHYRAEDGTLRPTLHPWYGHVSVDYLNPACADAFIAACYQSYYDRFADFFGTTIPGFFNDEPRFATAYPWSLALGEPPRETAEYRRALGEAMARNHFRRIRAWCDDHRALFTGHMMGEETLGSQTRYMGNAWETTSCYHWPGVDHLGPSASGQHPRLAASIAHLAGERAVTCETFAGCPWECTPRDLYRIAGWLYANGVTKLLFHGFFYTREGEAAQDWPPDLFFRWEGWSAMPAFVQWAGRVQYFLARAIPRAAVALYYPYEEFIPDFRPDPQYTLGYTDASPVLGDDARAWHLAFGDLMAAMLARGIDVDIVPAGLLGRVADRILVAPLLSEPAFAGTLLRQGERSAEACVEELDRLLGRRVRVTGEGAAPRPRPISPRLSDPYIHQGEDDGGVWVSEFRFEGRPAVMLWNANAGAFTGAVDLVERRAWSAWTPADGRVQPLGTRDTADIALPGYSMTVIVGA
ncbi:MAG TPA: glycosyl hydrolase [Armatimonadota bacterium]|nr:glycosyl hydrolase [Armatimonadota bacterium]